jgi:checkpoint serine/threonine-protein kinase
MGCELSGSCHRIYRFTIYVLSRADAERVYRTGIKRGARPVEGMKTAYQEFKNRPPLPSSSWRPTPSSKPPHPIRRNPLKNHLPVPTQPTTSSPEHNRYAVMLAPPAPGKRRERLRFDLSLLFTPEGVEFSGPEVRARSLGLLGKKWGPLPSATSKSTVRVKFDDDGKSNSMAPRDTTGMRRKSNMNREPTVTINTKEALADVFGMYNSPDKTVLRLDKVAGSKHAPVKKVEPVTPGLKSANVLLPTTTPVQSMSENANVPKTPGK